MNLEPSFVAAASAGRWMNGVALTHIRRMSTDSRQVREGDLFFAIHGERFDGHNFLGDVARKGAVAAVVEEKRVPAEPPALPLLAVEHTRKALGLVAAEYRKKFNLTVVAVCGSNGKTTTKELLASVFRQGLSTLWSDASFNNDIGVPLTLFKLEPEHEVAVVEAGTNHPGELAPLLQLIAPTHGVLTSIGREHLEFFGDIEGVLREEGMLAEALPQEGQLFLPGDSEWSAQIVSRTAAKVTLVGFSERNDWRILNLRPDKQGLRFQVASVQNEYSGEYRLQLQGRHQAMNACFAIAMGAALGLKRSEIERGLLQCKPAKMRLELWESNGVSVLDDSYNANADSMLAALQTFHDLPCHGRRIAVLGDMAELGQHSERAHEDVGRYAAELGVSQLFAVGKMAPSMARGAREAGLHRVFEFSDVDSAASAVKTFLKNGDSLLLKASRSTRLERIGECLRGGPLRNREDA